MKTNDILLMGLQNLLKTKIRSSLTILGVIIGIASLSSMISFGTGMQKNLSDTFLKNELFNSLRVIRQELSPENLAESGQDAKKNSPPALTDSLIKIIGRIPGVELAFPEISFPARLELAEKETRQNVSALPPHMGKYPPYNQLQAGQFFSSDTQRVAVISPGFLKRLHIRLSDQKTKTPIDTTGGFVAMTTDELLGKKLILYTASMKFPIGGMGISGFTGNSMNASRFIGEHPTILRIIGILNEEPSMNFNLSSPGIMIPLGLAGKIPRLDFNNVWDILDQEKEANTYSSVYVRFADPGDLEKIRAEIEKRNLHVIAFSDQLKEMRKSFILINSVLGAIGAVALLVAALGIINTMLMSVLERTREIGIMKSIGAGNPDIRKLFLLEASLIGVSGGALGLVLGWLVTKAANLIINMQMLKISEEPVELFFFPWWLLIGSMGFAILISTLAGLLPAMKASKTDPVIALRHD